MALDSNSIIDAIEANGRRLIDVARSDLDAAVTTCGDWKLSDLAAHMGWVHALVGKYVASRASEALSREEMPARAPQDDSVLDYASDGLQRVLDALRGVEFDTPVWTWAPDQTARFYFRRMLHETSIHRWDAEHAAGEPAPVNAEQACDGVDEYFDFVIPNALRRKPRELPPGSIHLHRSDGDGEWIVSAEGDTVTMEHAHRKGDAAVRGPASALFVAMWNRLPLDDESLEVIGDAAVARAWAALAP